jgi:hypothetical protein
MITIGVFCAGILQTLLVAFGLGQLSYKIIRPLSIALSRLLA